MGYFVRFQEQDSLVYASEVEDIIRYVSNHSSNSETVARKIISETTYFEVDYNEREETIIINYKDIPRDYVYVSWRPLQNLVAVEKKWRVVEASEIPEVGVQKVK